MPPAYAGFAITVLDAVIKLQRAIRRHQHRGSTAAVDGAFVVRLRVPTKTTSDCIVYTQVGENISVGDYKTIVSNTLGIHSFVFELRLNNKVMPFYRRIGEYKDELGTKPIDVAVRLFGGVKRTISKAKKDIAEAPLERSQKLTLLYQNAQERIRKKDNITQEVLPATMDMDLHQLSLSLVNGSDDFIDEAISELNEQSARAILELLHDKTGGGCKAVEFAVLALPHFFPEFAAKQKLRDSLDEGLAACAASWKYLFTMTYMGDNNKISTDGVKSSITKRLAALHKTTVKARAAQKMCPVRKAHIKTLQTLAAKRTCGDAELGKMMITLNSTKDDMEMELSD